MAPRSAFLEQQERLTRHGTQLWRSKDRNRYYTWDRLHSEVEVYDKRGHHLGAVDPDSGVLIKPAVKGRTISV